MYLIPAAAVLLLTLAGCASDPPRAEYDRLSDAISLHQQPKPERALPNLARSTQLEDYLIYAAMSSPDLEAAFSTWRAAVERVPQARSLPDPRLSYEYWINAGMGDLRQSVGISQTFPWFGKRRLDVDIATQKAEAEAQRLEVERLSLFFNIAELYYENYFLHRSIEIVQENIRLVSHLETVSRRRFAVGIAPHGEIVRAQVELGELENRLQTLKDQRQPLTVSINATLNRPLDAPLMVPDTIAQQRLQASPQYLLKVLSEENPELKALELMADSESITIARAKKQYYPDIMVGVGYMDMKDSSMSDPIAAMISINIPIWHSRYSSGVREASARYGAAGNRLETRRNMLAAQLERALYQYRDANRRISLFRDSLLPKARQALNVTQQEYEAGSAGFLDVTGAQRTLLEFDLSYERALTDHAVYLEQIRKLIGRNLPLDENLTEDEK